MRNVLTLFFGLMIAPAIWAETPPLGTRITELKLTEVVTEKLWSLSEQGQTAKATVVVFLGTECPVSNAYVPTLDKLQKTYSDRGVLVIGINSNAQDDLKSVAKYVKEFDVTFPVLKDEKGEIARRFRAERLPTAFVLDATGTVRYRGRIDDQFERGIKRNNPTANDLIDALEAVLNDKEVVKPSTSVVGCPINLPEKESLKVKSTEITYSKHVSRIIQANCQNCHRPGEVGPFSMMNYRDAVAWSQSIREVVTEGIMPPWNADPKHGRFANDRRLSKTDREQLLAWVDAGCPEGDKKDLPPAKEYVKGWGIGQPDEIIAMNEAVNVPAQSPKGGVAYKYIEAGKRFTEDRWVQAAEVRPDFRGAVHHIIVYILKPGQSISMLSSAPPSVGDILIDLLGQVNGAAREMPEMLVAYVPGDQAFILPKGVAKKITVGSQLVFEMHYTPNGKAGKDRSSVGIVYAKEPPKHRLVTDQAINDSFAIPPNEGNEKVVAEYPFSKDVVLLSLSPHMHLRGKSFEYRLIADGKEEVILSVPKYDFNWQQSYILAEPKRVAKGAKLQCVAVFDNSKNNPNNPDPTKTVQWGEQTWQEMMLGFFEYYDAPKQGEAK